MPRLVCTALCFAMALAALVLAVPFMIVQLAWEAAADLLDLIERKAR